MRGLGDLRNLMQQAQKLQEEISKKQEELAQARVEGSAGGGVVRAVVNGQGELLQLTIAPEALSEGDHQLLEDLVVAAVGDAQAKAKELAQKLMSGLTGGFPPGVRE